MKTRIHREKKEYLPELKVGEVLAIGPIAVEGRRMIVEVDENLKSTYEAIAKETGLNFQEIWDEFAYIVRESIRSGESDSSFAERFPKNAIQNLIDAILARRANDNIAPFIEHVSIKKKRFTVDNSNTLSTKDIDLGAEIKFADDDSYSAYLKPELLTLLELTEKKTGLSLMEILRAVKKHLGQGQMGLMTQGQNFVKAYKTDPERVSEILSKELTGEELC